MYQEEPHFSFFRAPVRNVIPYKQISLLDTWRYITGHYARRRTEEMRAKGQEADFETIRADIIQRDYQDSHRAFRPLQKAEDAVEIDSTDMSIDNVVDTMMAFIEARDR